MSKYQKSQDISRALHPTLPVIAMSRKYFLAPAPQDRATHGVLERQPCVIYNLETAPPEAIAYLMRCAVHTAKEPINFHGIDQTAWGPMDRWWAVNEILEHGGTLPLYDGREAALAALAESEVAHQ